jgi:hypothetical protein
MAKNARYSPLLINFAKDDLIRRLLNDQSRASLVVIQPHFQASSSKRQASYLVALA